MAAPLATRACDYCGCTYQPTTATSRGCSKKCSQRLRFVGAAVRKQRNCEICNTTYDATYTAQRTCSRACGAAIRQAAGSYELYAERRKLTRKRWPQTRIYFRDCVICARPFTTRRALTTLCGSAHCTRQVRNGKDRVQRAIKIACRSVTQHTCTECGAAFAAKTRSNTGRWCSYRCAHRAAKRTRKHILRSRSVTGERFTTRQIAERDGWRCHLCHKRVTKDEASMDHLIPISAGGLHIRSNVALAHRRCNTLRCNTGPAQLLLFG